jgi:hypothetical protein
LDQVTSPDSLSATVDGRRAKCSKVVCVDPVLGQYEVGVFLPGTAGAGAHWLEIFHNGMALPPERVILGMLEAGEVFRGVAWNERLLEIGRDGSCAVGGDIVIADPALLPFRDGLFAGVVQRSGQLAAWDELKRVLKADGALYLESPPGSRVEPGGFIREAEARTGLPFRWRRDLARSLARNRALPQVKPRTLTGYLMAVVSFALRAVDRCLGTRTARGGMGFYFGEIWNTKPDLRPRLNGCVGCGSVHSSDQLRASASLMARFLLVFYLCPTCGTPNILSIDR